MSLFGGGKKKFWGKSTWFRYRGGRQWMGDVVSGGWKFLGFGCGPLGGEQQQQAPGGARAGGRGRERLWDG